MKGRLRPLEKEVLAQCREYLRLHGFEVVRLNSGAVTGSHKGKSRLVRFNDTPGVSDLLAVKKGAGLAVFVEVKRPGGKTTPAQDDFLNRMRCAGAVGIVADSLDSLRQQLEAHGL